MSVLPSTPARSSESSAATTGPRDGLLLRLVLATAGAEAVGLVAAGAVSALVAARVAEGAAVGLTLAGGLVVGMLEGALVGWGQAWALRFERAARLGLVRATAAGFGVGWTIGLATSIVGIDMLFGESLASDWGALLGAPVFGAGFGAIVGPIQAGWLAPICSRRRWIVASILAWALGFVPPQVIALILQHDAGLPDAAILTALSGALTGAVVGGVLAASVRGGPSAPPDREIGL